MVFVLSLDANIFFCFQAKYGSEPYMYILVNIPASSEERIAQRANKGFVLTFHVSVTPKMQRGGCRNCCLLRVSDVLHSQSFVFVLFQSGFQDCNTGGVAVVFSRGGKSFTHFSQLFVFVFANLFVFVIWPRGMQRCCF